jgi:hypothetical protein
MAAKYFNFVDGQRLPGARVKEFLMNQAVIQCENQTEITSSGIEALGARVAINLEDGQLWTYTPDIEAWAPAQNTLDLDLLDARYYTKVAANGIFISETTADARYLTEVTARGIFLTQTDAGTTYYTKLQADGLFMTETTSDARYYTKLQADGLFITTTVGDARYITEARAGTLFISKGGAAGDINGNSTTIDGGKITTNSLHANRIAAGTLTASSVSAGTLVGSTIRTSTNAGERRAALLGGNDSNPGRLAFFAAGDTSAAAIIEAGDNSGSLSIRSGGSASISIGTASTVFNGNISTSNGSGISSTGNLNVISNSNGSTVFTSDNSGNVSARSISLGNVSGSLNAPGVYNNQGGTSANLFVASNGNFARITSARKYKEDIQDIDYGLAALELQPKTWVSKEEYVENNNSAEGLTRHVGFIAEDLDDLGLTELVYYDNGEPDSINYDRMTTLLIPVIKQQQERIDALEARLAALEGGAQ